MPIDFKLCREDIAGALQEFCNRWCKLEHVETNALNSWKLNIFKITDVRISSYCNNLDLLPPKPKFTFRQLKKGIQEFHKRFILAPADKAANNEHNRLDETSIVDRHRCHIAAKFGLFVDEDHSKLSMLYWLP